MAHCPRLKAMNNMSFLNKISPYIDILNPKRSKEFISKSKDISNLKPSLYNVLIATIITMIISILQNTALQNYIQTNVITDPTQAEAAAQLLLILEKTLSIPFILLNFFIGIAFFYLIAYAFYFLIKMLGGKSNFNSHAYVLSVLYTSFILASMLLYAIIFIFYRSTQPDIFVGILALIILILTLYAVYRIMRVLHDLSLWAAIIGLLGFIAIFYILVTALERALIKLTLGI